MLPKRSIVITSINPPNMAMSAFAEGAKKHGIDMIVIGDAKSPERFVLEGCDFIGLREQRLSAFHTATICPENHYSRKNIGYLSAMQRGTDQIIDTDDDNLPYDNFWEPRAESMVAAVVSGPGWINVYKYFSNADIWPRGLPLTHARDSVPPLNSLPRAKARCPIQQGLANENPDVDAIYRLTRELPISFDGDETIVLAERAWCPFNSQNTIWFRSAFPLMYLPTHCPFRMTDIWRSFIAQRIAWANHWNTLFFPPTVWQERNEHDLMADFADEIPGYLKNDLICKFLSDLDLKPGESFLLHNIRACYAVLVEKGVFPKEELHHVDAWCTDVAVTTSV